MAFDDTGSIRCKRAANPRGQTSEDCSCQSRPQALLLSSHHDVRTSIASNKRPPTPPGENTAATVTHDVKEIPLTLTHVPWRWTTPAETRCKRAENPRGQTSEDCSCQKSSASSAAVFPTRCSKLDFLEQTCSYPSGWEYSC